MRVRAAVSFLTPLGGPAVPSPQALTAFPLVGAVVGLAVGSVWWLGDRVWPALIAAAAALVADLALTGMLHLDGLCDTADGLLPVLPGDEEEGAAAGRRLAIMASPEVGAFGVGAAAATLLLRFSVLASMAPEPLLVGGLWAGSRTAMAVTVTSVPYARPGGLAQAFRGGEAGRLGSAVPAVLGAVVAVALAVGGVGAVGAVGVAVLAAGAWSVVALARRRIGGFTGDVLGAAGVLGETAGLLAVAALV